MTHMKQATQILLLLCYSIFVMVIGACSSDDNTIINNTDPENIENTVTASVSEITEATYENITRSNYDYDEKDNKLHFSWKKEDKIYAYAGDAAVCIYNLSSGADQSLATFNARGFDLTPKATYYGFINKQDSAFQTTKATEIYADYRGQKQIGNYNSDHLGAFDFSNAVTTATEDHTAHFPFTHLGSVLLLELTVPETGEFTELILDDKLSAERKLYPRQVVDITQNDPYFQKVILKDNSGNVDEIANTYNLLLRDRADGEDGISITKDGVLKVFIWLPTANYTGQTFRATLRNKDGKEYYTTFGGGTMEKGRFYRIKKKTVPSGILSVTIRVDKDWKLGDTKEDKTRAGDPGIDEKLGLPTSLMLYTTIDRGATGNKLEHTTPITNIKESDWIREGKTNVYRYKENVIIQIDNARSDAENVHVYAYAHIDAPTISQPTLNTTADSQIQSMKFSVDIDNKHSEQDTLKNLYSTTPEQGSTAYNGNEMMYVGLTLYHTAAKMDFQWDFTSSANRFSGFTANNLLNTGFLFKPTENTVPNPATSHTYTHSVGANAAEKYAGRHVFYAIQQGGTSWPLSVTTQKNNVADITSPITFTPSVTNGWTSWLKANITPAPPAP